ncbi:MAG: glycosyltransferase family 9 protein [Acidobacteriota bacterium]
MHTQSKFRLLVVRLGAMGDILHALPAVTALRQRHPAWQIDWLVEPAWIPLLSCRSDRSRMDIGPDQPVVNRVIPACTKAWGRRPFKPATYRELREIRKTLLAGGYDAVIDFQGAVRSAFLGRATAAPRRIGESSPREWAARWLYTDRVATRGAHVIDQDVELAACLAGDPLEPVQPWLPVDAAAEAWCTALLGGDTRPVALLNPGAGWGAKRWPTDRYAAVARELATRGFRALVNVGPKEESLAEEIQIRSEKAAQPVRCSLAELTALTRRAAVVIAGDTGPLHLACALGRPVVGIYGPTDPARNGPYGTRFKVLRHPESVRDHRRHHEPEWGLLTIQPQDVFEAVEQVLSVEAVQ